MLLNEALDNMTESGLTPEQFGNAVIFSVEECSPEDVGKELVSILQSLENDDEFAVFEKVLTALTSKSYDELIEENDE